MRDLLIYGAGGFAREVHQLVVDLVADGAPFHFIGFLSDDPASHGTTVAGHPVLGDASYLDMRSNRFAVALGVGSPNVKRRLVTRVAGRALEFPSLIHPTIVRSARIRYGQGFIGCAGSVLTTDISIGDFVTLNLACTVGHDVVLAPYVTIAPGSNISGNVHIEEGCDVGTGVKVIQGRSIGAWTIVGAGAVVTSDLPPNCTAVGVPARVIKRHDDSSSPPTDR